MITVDVVVGWTGDLDFQLVTTDVNGVESAQDLTGMTVTLIARRSNGDLIDTSGDDVTVFDAVNGKVRFNADAADFPSPDTIRARWKVVQSGKTVYFPNGAPDEWRVWAE